MLPATLPPVSESPLSVVSSGPIVLPEEAREIIADGFWRAADERLRQRKGLPPAPRSDCFPSFWFQHGFTLDETAATLWGTLWRTVALAQEVVEAPASVMGQQGVRHTLLVGHLTRIATLYRQLERWQGKPLALTLLEQALELLC